MLQLHIEQYSGKCEVSKIHGTAPRFALAAARSCLSHASCDAAGEAYGSVANRNVKRRSELLAKEKTAASVQRIN